MWLHFFIIFYILILGVFFGARGNQNKNKRLIYIIFTFGLFFIIAAFRADSVGNDTIEYLRIFNIISLKGDISNLTPRYEVGYLYLNMLLSSLVSNPQIIIIITSFIIMLGFATFVYKYSQIHWLSTYLFFTLGYYGMSMNTIRLNIAIVILLFAYDYLRKRKLVKFILLVFIAFLFHKTALIFLLAWPITRLAFNYKTVLKVIIASILLYTMFPIVLQFIVTIFPTYQNYLGSEYLDGEIRIASVMNVFVGLSIILFGVFIRYYKETDILPKPKIKGIEKENINDGKLMLLLILTGVAINFISFKFNLLDKVGDYFLVFSCVYLPNAINQIKDKNFALVSIYIVVVLFFIYVTVIQIARPEWNVIYPYEFFWSF